MKQKRIKERIGIFFLTTKWANGFSHIYLNKPAVARNLVFKRKLKKHERNQLCITFKITVDALKTLVNENYD